MQLLRGGQVGDQVFNIYEDFSFEVGADLVDENETGAFTSVIEEESKDPQ